MEGKNLSSLLNQCARCLMQLTKYKVVKVPREEQDSTLQELMYGGVNKKGESIPGYTPSQIVDVVNNLLEISSKIRQIIPDDIYVQVNLLKVVDRFSKLRDSAVK